MSAALTHSDIITPARGKAHWARDFAIVGGVSSFLAPFLVAGTLLGWPTMLVTTLAGALTGAGLGALLAGPGRGSLAAVSWPPLALLFLAVGACWGALVGAIGALTLTLVEGTLGLRGSLEVWLLFMGCAAVAGAAQLAWFGVGYLFAERAGHTTWPLVVGACGTPFLGWAALHLVPLGLHAGGALR